MTTEQEISNLVKNTITTARNSLNQEIERFWDAHRKIMNQDIPLVEKLSQIKVLIDQYKLDLNDETSRDSQIQHKNNDEPLARNRHIIKAQLDQHNINYDDNWDHNQDHANGKYTLKKKEEWLEIKSKLESELKNSVN